MHFTQERDTDTSEKPPHLYFIWQELVGGGTPLTEQHLYDALEMLRGAVTIVYPMGLPMYDPIRQELENREDLTGTQDLKMVSSEVGLDCCSVGQSTVRCL